MEKRSYILSILAVAISIVTLAVIMIKVSPYNVIDLGTFMGIMAAFIGICVTLLVGVQIYNAIEIRQKLTEIDKLKILLDQTKTELEKAKADILDSTYSVAAKAVIDSNRSEEAIEAFRYMNQSVQYALDIDDSRQNYCKRIDYIAECCLKLQLGNGIFDGTQAELQQKVEKYQMAVQPIIDAIRKHPKYHIIADEYEYLIQAYEARMTKIKNLQYGSLDSIYDDIK